MASDLVFTAGNVFVSATAGGTAVTTIKTGTPFFVEAPVTSTDAEEFNEGKAYSLRVVVNDLSTLTNVLNTTIVGGQGDANLPALVSTITVPAGNAGITGSIYQIFAVMLSGRNPVTVDFALGSSLVVVVP